MLYTHPTTAVKLSTLISARRRADFVAGAVQGHSLENERQCVTMINSGIEEPHSYISRHRFQLKWPSFFLDECTSGLDSEMALALVGTLKNLAVRMHKTIALTIHQPNSLITSKFDDFMLLAGGELVYFGDWDGAVPFFNTAGLHCPQYTNPTDFFLNCLQEQNNVDILVEQQRRKGASSLLQSVQDEEAVVATNNGGVSSLAAGGGIDAGKDIRATHPEVPGWYQTCVLTQRSYRNYIRNPAMLFSETAQYMFMGLFVGLMYLQLNNSVETGINDRLGKRNQPRSSKCIF